MTPNSINKDPIDTVKQIVETQAADGIILCGTKPNDRRLNYLHEGNILSPHPGASSRTLNRLYFDFDNTAYGLNAVQVLAKLQRKRIVMVLPPLDQTDGRHM